MDQVLSAQFERVEKALGTLVDSIAAYNPAPQAAIDLVVADEELSQGLDELARHQANHARIQALRSEAEALEEQLKSSISTLASLRHELFETPATTFPEYSRPVNVQELLQYAKNISKHTVPPTYRERAPAAATDKDKDEAASSGAPTNGVNTPANVPESMDLSKSTPEAPKEGQVADNAPVEITAEEEEWLKKLKDSKIAWYPWPSDDKVRSGNLYKLMYWQAKNKDLDEFDIYAHEEAERLKDMATAEQQEAAAAAAAEPPERVITEQQPHVPRPAPAPRQEKETFDAWDDLDD